MDGFKVVLWVVLRWFYGWLKRGFILFFSLFKLIIKLK